MGGEENGTGDTAARERNLGTQYCWPSGEQAGLPKVIPVTKSPPMPCSVSAWFIRQGTSVYGWKVKLEVFIIV